MNVLLGQLVFVYSFNFYLAAFAFHAAIMRRI
jgi:hypothetical protein